MHKQTQNTTKRIVTKIGYIFCVEFPNNTKGYFQYIANDYTLLNSSVIRVFKTHYPINENVEPTRIIDDDIDFYAHTILKPGIHSGAWYKIGKSVNLGTGEINEIKFGTTEKTRIVHTKDGYEVIDINPLKNWMIWKINCEMVDVGKLPKKYYDKLELGYVIPYIDIINRMYFGYYKYTCPENAVIKRYPRPDVFSYLKYHEDNEDFFLCFHGNHFEKAVISKNGVKKKVTIENPVISHKKITQWQFSDTNWKYDDFITEEEFYEEWNAVQ